MSRLRLLSAALLLGLSPPVVAPVLAHVVAHPDTGTAGSSFETTFNVSHGCDGSATVAVTMKIPDGVLFVKPRWMAGWNVTIKKRKLDIPAAAYHGKTALETVDEITWRGGPLANDLYETFSVRMKLPDTPGRTLYFPVVQQCIQGAHRWVEIPPPGKGWTDMHEPPPFVRVTPKEP